MHGLEVSDFAESHAPVRAAMDLRAELDGTRDLMAPSSSEGDDGTTFLPPFGTVRMCRKCGCLVAGGPTVCGRCAGDADAEQEDVLRWVMRAAEGLPVSDLAASLAPVRAVMDLRAKLDGKSWALERSQARLLALDNFERTKVLESVFRAADNFETYTEGPPQSVHAVTLFEAVREARAFFKKTGT